MRYYAYRGEAPNFGDELNHYMMPRLLDGLLDGRDDPLVLGIGSILFDHHPDDVTKLVVGSGYGHYTPKPGLDDRWKIYAVRGPRTAEALGLDRRLVAADLAVLINRHRAAPGPKRHKRAFMPHFQSLPRADWASVAQQADMYLIDPRWPVEQVMEAIEQSELLVAEAMHGAVVADALRTPWIALTPLDPSHHFKWHDWVEALGMKLRPRPLVSASLYEALDNFRFAGRSGKRFIRPWQRPLRAVGRRFFEQRAAESLARAAETAPMLSSDQALAGAIAHLEESLAAVRRDFA
jgi:succinoglycan biosynthesis protein ExoV